MPHWREYTNRINCYSKQTVREVRFNGNDTGLVVGRPIHQWSDDGVSRSRTWVRTSNYQALKKSGQLPDNALNYEQTIHNSQPMITVQAGTNTSGGNWDFKSYYYKTEYTHTPLVRPRQYTDLDVTALIARAKLDVIKAAKSNQFNAPVFAAEASKTGEMVYARAKQLAGIFLSLKRGDIGRAITSLHPQFNERVTIRRRKRIIRRFNRARFVNPQQAAADTWLELQYGWIPFVSEVSSAVNTLMDVVDEPSNRVIRVRGNQKANSLTTLVETGGYPQLVSTTVESQSVSVRVNWRAEALSADLPGRFGLTNPVEVAWELLPYSFVVDWFAPVGDYLSALDAPLRFKHKGGVVGIKQQLKKSTTIVHGKGFVFASGRTDSERILVSVDRLSSVPVPSVTDLVLKPHLTPSRVASGLALLKQAFR